MFISRAAHARDIPRRIRVRYELRDTTDRRERIEDRPARIMLSPCQFPRDINGHRSARMPRILSTGRVREESGTGEGGGGGSGNDRGLLDRSRKAGLTRIADRSNRITAIYGVYSGSSQVTGISGRCIYASAPFCGRRRAEFRRPDGNFDALRTRRDDSRRFRLATIV